MIRRPALAVLALAAAGGLGVALGAALAGSSSTKTRTVSVASRVGGPVRTVISVRTVGRVRTRVRTVAVPGPAVPIGGVPAKNQPHGRHKPQQFSGTGLRVLGAITVPQPGATLYWTNSGGRFRLLFNGTGVAVDSTAHSGQINAPPLTYKQVTVNTPGHWTIRIS